MFADIIADIIHVSYWNCSTYKLEKYVICLAFLSFLPDRLWDLEADFFQLIVPFS